jgi:CRP-like cAMP-binding protein
MARMNEEPPSHPYLSDPSWSHLFCGPVEWPTGLCLLHQDRVPTVVYVVDTGVVKMSQVTSNGDECVIDVRSAPCLIGSTFVIARQPSTLNAVTVTKCTLRWCKAEALTSALTTDAARLKDVLRLHNLEVLQLVDRIACLAMKSSKQRLHRFLSTFSEMGDDSERPAQLLPFKQSDLASIINVTPEHLSRMLTKMAKAGITHRPIGVRRRGAVQSRGATST